jgi:pyrimidine-specific ribonucleoside hydrolase
VFAGYEPSSYTHIGNIDLASLDRRGWQWLFDVVQPGWKTRSILLEDLFLWLFDAYVITHPEYFTYYKEYSDQSKL